MRLTRKQFKKLIEDGKLRVEADFFHTKNTVKHSEAPLVFKVEKRRNQVELKFVGFD